MADQKSEKLWRVEVNGRLWETYQTERAGIRNWKTLAYNGMFRNAHVVLYDPWGVPIKEKFPRGGKL